MIFALTGTPGTGKTAVSSIIKERRGYSIIDINKLILDEKLTVGKDEGRGSYIADIEKLERRVKQIIKTDSKKDIIMEGHLSHLLPSDAIIVLRAEPAALRKRLGTRAGYSFEKIKENVEAEALDVILVESSQKSSNVFEINTTDKTEKDVAEYVISIIESLKKGNKSQEFFPGKIDWIDYVISDHHVSQ